MINPASFGWVDKFFFEQNYPLILNVSIEEFYSQTRKTGFVMGYTTHFAYTNKLETKDWLDSDFSKIGLLSTLFNLYQIKTNKNSKNQFVEQSILFYKKIHPKSAGLLEKIVPNDTFSSKLEKNLNSRIQTNDNLISKNFSHILTNALLFIDVLAFEKHVENNFENPEKYIKKIEEIIVNIVSLALNTKTKQSKYDDLLKKLFESSVRYSKFYATTTQIENIDFSIITTPLEKLYILDIAAMAMWSDGEIEKLEIDFLNKLSQQININKQFVAESILEISNFLSENKNKLPYFNYSNPVKHFYDQTANSVQVLISKNKSRLLLELNQSKELVKLLKQSTQRELDVVEKKKVKKQLLDICKTIPSLTLFLLPGGSLLLPLFIKFIPQLLPSAFNDNLYES